MRRSKHQSVAEDEINRLLRGWNGKEDVDVAILAGTFVEDRLGFAIKSKSFINLPPTGNNETMVTETAIFDGQGPLATFYAKIDIGYALGLYELDQRFDFHIVRSIRNDFAHRLETLTFSDH